MIGKLKGKIEFIGEDKLILDVNGVGYNVYAAAKTLDFLQAKKDQEFSLLIETIVREDSITLYGFLTQTEQSWFNELCKVNGVGNKVALKILGILSINDIILALNSGDKSVFSRVSGIGPKLALRIVSELKDSAKKLSGEFFVSNKSTNLSQDNSTNNKISSDAISALENLGYKRSDIYSIVSEQLNQNPDMTLETLITQSLRLLTTS